jgi:hypothetical protein
MRGKKELEEDMLYRRGWYRDVAYNGLLLIVLSIIFLNKVIYEEQLPYHTTHPA